jgi:lipid II:glycine glycyltransferase (peptidoglycan interpeptide bridge formation enzyme)
MGLTTLGEPQRMLHHLNIVHTLAEADWRSFVNQHPQGNIFHTPEMFQVFQRAKGHQPTLWATVDEKGKILAFFLPIQIALGGWFLGLLTTRAVSYGSVLYQHSPLGKEALVYLLNTYLRSVNPKVLFTELRNQVDLKEIQATLSNSGFDFEDHLNFHISLNRPLDEILQGLGRRTRKHIRQGLRRGEVVIEEAVTPEQISLCYEVLRQTYKMARVPLADRSLFEAAFDVLCPLGMVKFLLARIGENYIAASVELAYKNILYGWYGGVNRGYSSYAPNELLIWYILQWGAEHGYQMYDFGGAGKPDEPYGVRDFKAKFGGELVNYGRNTYYHAPRWFAVSKVGYQIYRRLLNFQR